LPTLPANNWRALYGGYGAGSGDKGRYEVTATDPKTGYQTRTYIPGESSKFFENNAGANVLFAKNKEPGQIIEGVGMIKPGKNWTKFIKAYDEGKFDLRTRNKLWMICDVVIQPTSKRKRIKTTSKRRANCLTYRARNN
jgi:hypothetical protein